MSVIVLFVVLQADNGGEFHGAAYSAKEDANVTVGEIIQELGQLWPGCRMAASKGSTEPFKTRLRCGCSIIHLGTGA
jgi:hypothetical protein